MQQKQLFDSLSPHPLLESDLLSIDESILKNNLPESSIIGNVGSTEDNIVANFIPNFSAEKEQFDNNEHGMKKSLLPDELECENKLCK